MIRFMGMFISAAAICLLISVVPAASNAQIALVSCQMTSNAIDDGSVDVAVDGDGNTHVVYARDGNIYYKLNLNEEELAGGDRPRRSP
jgi:hypothetical protein